MAIPFIRAYCRVGLFFVGFFRKLPSRNNGEGVKKMTALFFYPRSNAVSASVYDGGVSAEQA